MIPPPPTSTLFPYTTLFRSVSLGVPRTSSRRTRGAWRGGEGPAPARAVGRQHRPALPPGKSGSRHAVLQALVGAHADGQEDARAGNGVLCRRVRRGAVRRVGR